MERNLNPKSFHTSLYKYFFAHEYSERGDKLPDDLFTYVWKVVVAALLIVPFELLSFPNRLFKYIGFGFVPTDSVGDKIFASIIEWFLIATVFSVLTVMYLTAERRLMGEPIGEFLFIGAVLWGGFLGWSIVKGGIFLIKKFRAFTNYIITNHSPKINWKIKEE